MVLQTCTVIMRQFTKTQFCQSQPSRRNTIPSRTTDVVRLFAAGVIRVAKQGTDKNLADLFTKVLTVARRNFLLERFSY